MNRQVVYLALVLSAPALAAEPAKPSPPVAAAQKPAARAPFVEKAGLVVLEAEHFTGRVQGTEMTDHDWTETKVAEASGGLAVEAAPNNGAGTGERTTAPALEYAVRFTKTGTYYVWLRMTGASGQDDSVHAGMDGKAATFGGIGMCHATHGAWQWVNTVWERSDPPRVKVDVAQPGMHRFQLWMREDGVRIDKVVLASDPAFTPTGPGPAESPSSP